MNKKYNKTNNKRWVNSKPKQKNPHFTQVENDSLSSPVSAKFFKNPFRVTNFEKQEFFDFLQEFEKHTLRLERRKGKLNSLNDREKFSLYRFYQKRQKLKKEAEYLESQRKYFKKFEGALGPNFQKITKDFRLDPYSQKYQINSMFRFKSLHRKKVKLDRSYRMWFRKPHIRTNQRPVNRWAFVLAHFFKHFYKLNYFMTQVNYISSVSDANQKINYKRLTKNNSNVKSSASVSAGDLVVYNKRLFDLEDMLNSKKMRSHLNTFLEEDDYVQGAVALKNATELSREDTLSLNIPSTRFTDINFLRK
jgi:hypothetical protein